MADDYKKETRVETIDVNNRPCMIELKDKRVNIRTHRLSISRKHKLVMLIDLFTLSWVSGIFVLLITLNNLSWLGIFAMGCLGLLMWTCALGKTICDFRDWMFTMQSQIDKIGDWSCDDVVNICNDLIRAGIKYAQEEVEKAKKGEVTTDAGEGIQETKVE